MRICALTLAISLMTTTSAFALPDDASWNAILGKYVKPYQGGINYFDYAGLKSQPSDVAKLKAYVTALQTEKVSALTRPQQFAYWSNLYNALTIQVMIDNWPVKSIREIKSKGAPFDPVKSAFGGPWRQKFVTVDGKALTLDDIEHGILRVQWQEPRVHYAVNCASYGCPNLKASAWNAETLEADLDAGAKAYVNHPRGVKVNANGTLTLSSIYKWFAEDFGGNEVALKQHLTKYATPELAARIKTAKIAGNEYSWAVNAPPKNVAEKK